MKVWLVLALTSLLVGVGCDNDSEEVAPNATATTVNEATLEPSSTADATTVDSFPPTLVPSTTAAASTSPRPVPSDWRTYSDPAGFSFSYPPDLELADLTGPSPLTGERTLLMSSATNSARVLSLSIIESPSLDVDLTFWSVETGACREGTIEDTLLGGSPAVSCVREVIAGLTSEAVIAAYKGSIFLISAGPGLNADETAVAFQNLELDTGLR